MIFLPPIPGVPPHLQTTLRNQLRAQMQKTMEDNKLRQPDIVNEGARIAASEEHKKKRDLDATQKELQRTDFDGEKHKGHAKIKKTSKAETDNLTRRIRSHIDKPNLDYVA